MKSGDNWPSDFRESEEVYRIHDFIHVYSPETRTDSSPVI